MNAADLSAEDTFEGAQLAQIISLRKEASELSKSIFEKNRGDGPEKQISSEDMLRAAVLLRFFSSVPLEAIDVDKKWGRCIACDMRKTALIPTDMSVTPEYLEWLKTQSRNEGVAGNEAWNAGVAWKTKQMDGPQDDVVNHAWIVPDAKTNDVVCNDFKTAFHAASQRGVSHDGAIRSGLVAAFAVLPTQRPNRAEDVAVASLEEIARSCALGSQQHYDYLPASKEDFSHWKPHDWMLRAMRLAIATDRFWNQKMQEESQNDFPGDRLPPIGSRVMIHLGSANAWVEHQVCGYAAMPDLKGDPSLQRVYVKVKSQGGYSNSRLLKDVRRKDGTPFIKQPEAKGVEEAV